MLLALGWIVSGSAVAETPSASDLVAFMLVKGGSGTSKPGTASHLLDLPGEFDTFPVRGDSTNEGELGIGIKSHCVVIQKPESLTPLCLIITHEVRHLDEHRLESFKYRFSLNGILERAVLITGPLNEQGHAVKGAGTSKPLDISDPSVKRAANEELQLWLRREADEIAKAKEAK
jgi:hypothetical protein